MLNRVRQRACDVLLPDELRKTLGTIFSRENEVRHRATLAKTARPVGIIESAHLRVHRTGLAAHPLACAVPRDPLMSAPERLLFEAVVKEAKESRFSS